MQPRFAERHERGTDETYFTLRVYEGTKYLVVNCRRISLATQLEIRHEDKISDVVSNHNVFFFVFLYPTALVQVGVTSASITPTFFFLFVVNISHAGQIRSLYR